MADYDLVVRGGSLAKSMSAYLSERVAVNPRIRVRSADVKHFDREAAIVIDILNDAWSDNWGFVPFTEKEAKYAGKKMVPLIRPDINMIAELDGEPVAFMLTWPDANEPIKRIGGKGVVPATSADRFALPQPQEIADAITSLVGAARVPVDIAAGARLFNY